MSDVVRQIREKFPAYKDVPDDDLTIAIGEKYPVYLEQDPEFASDFKRLNGTTTAETTQPAPFTIPEDPRGRNPSAPNPAWDGVKFTEPTSLGQMIATGLPFHKLAPDPQTVRDARDVLTAFLTSSPNTSSTREILEGPSNKPQTADKITAGAVAAGLTVPETMTSPLGIATLGTSALGATGARLVSGAFTVDILSKQPERIVDVYEAFKLDLGPEEATKRIGGLVLDVAMLSATAKHAATAPKPVVEATDFVKPGDLLPQPIVREVAPLEVAAVKAEAAGAPATAEAVRAQAIEFKLEPSLEPLVQTPYDTSGLSPAEKLAHEKFVEGFFGENKAIDVSEPKPAVPETIPPAGETKAPVAETKEPWQMRKAEGDRYLDENMINAVKTDKGKVIAKNVEHGDLMPALEESGSTFKNSNARGWSLVGRKPSESYIGVADLEPAKADFHKAWVMKALREGKPVPPEVLADYPDLKPAEASPKGIAASARAKLAGESAGSEAGVVTVPEWMKTAGEWIRPRDEGAVPEMVMDETHVLPRLNEYATEKANASSPRGAGAVPILGKLLDPRARAYGPVEQSIIGHAASKAKGDTIAALWAEANAVTRPKSLIADEAGTIPLADGARGYLSDVIEAEMRQPGSQSLLPEQRQWVDEVWKPLNEDLKTMMAGENVRGFEMDESGVVDLRTDYFPRPAIGKRDVEGKKGGAGGGKVGSRQFFQKKRLFESEAEGAPTTIYEPDPVKRVATLISRAYKAVADTRLANDEALGGQTIARRFDAINAERGGVLDSMSEPERLATLREWRDEAAHPLFMKEGTVDQPAFRGKIFPIETAQKLQKHYADYSQSWLGKVSNVSRSFQLTLDMSAPFNQGLVLMYRNPVAWGKGVAESWKALAQAETMGKYLQVPENAAAARELAQLGVSLRRMQDFVSGKTPDDIPGIKQTGRAFGVFMDVAKIEHWKSLREIYPREKWPELAEALDNSLLSGRIEQTGITPRSAHYERLAALAASYYRGGVGLVSTALQRGVGGKEARKALAAFSVGVTATSIAGMLAAGLTWDEIAERLNPSKGKFMRVPITIGDKKIEAGFGNILLSFSRLLGETVEAANSDSPIRSGSENNPWIRWSRGKLGPVPAFGTDVAVGRDIMGKELGVGKAAVNRFTPITVQQGSGEGTVGGKSVDAALSFLGLQAYPQNVRELFSNERERIAKEKHGKSYEDLPIREQALISRALEKEERFKRPEGTARQREMAYQADIDRVNRITEGLSKESNEKIKALGVKLAGYDATIPAGGKPLSLTRNQTAKYEKLIIEEYERILQRVDVLRFEKMDVKQRQKRINDMLLIAKNRARGRLRNEAR